MTRFIEAVGEDGARLIIDTSHNPPIVICGCIGFNARFRAEMVLEALRERHSRLMQSLGMEPADVSTPLTRQRRGSGTKREQG